MISLNVILAIVLSFVLEPIAFSNGEPDPICCKEDWGYVNVREDAHMFWWLYYSTKEPYTAAPLVLWLQGGPGASSSGYGNFVEIGPLDEQLNPRNTTWVSAANVLFIDNPVGTGYSYVTSPNAYTTNNDEIARDLLGVMTAFFETLPEFQDIPFYIFGESYGGKMTAGFSKLLHREIREGEIRCNFRGLALGDSWINILIDITMYLRGLDSVMSWAPYLHATSLLDHKGRDRVTRSALRTKAAFDAGKFQEATELFFRTEFVIMDFSPDIDFYNILESFDEELRDEIMDGHGSPIEKLYLHHVKPFEEDNLATLMNGPIKEKLGIIPENVTWSDFTYEVFENLADDFMIPVVDVVDYLISNTSLSVVVYTGQLDLIVDTLGTEWWIQKLTWPGLKVYNKITWTPMYIDSLPARTAFIKALDNFSMYWILNAGHSVPKDQGEVSLKMLQMITGNNN